MTIHFNSFNNFGAILTMRQIDLFDETIFPWEKNFIFEHV